MKNRNCPNCGAPYDIALNKCPYCGTSYYDMSALDFSTNEPFYLKIKTTINGMPCYITQLVRPTADLSIELSSETVDYYDGYGSVMNSVVSSQSLTTNIAFQAVTLPGRNNLLTLEIAD